VNALAPMPARPVQAVRAAPDIVVVNDYAHIQGGGSKVAIVSAAALARRGHRVTFFAAVAPVDPDLAASGAEIVCLGQPDMLGDPSALRAALRGLWNGEAGRRFGTLLDRLDPACTVVHVHGWMKALSSSVVRAATDRGFRVIGTLHDYTAVCPNGGLFNYRSAAPCTLTPLSPRCIATDCDARNYGHKLWRVARHAVQQRRGGFSRPFGRYVCLSDLNRRLHAGRLPEGARMEMVRNPIDVPRGPPADPACHDTFLFVGRLAAEKGPLLFATAAAEAGVPAAFVGDGYLAAAVRAAAPQAELTGWQPAEAVARRLRHARALVFPSLWPETQGMAVSEAAALGVPAIVSDGCAAREAVEDGVTGLLFRSGDSADLRRQIERCRDDALVARMGRAAHARFWADPPTVDAHARALVALYAQVLEDEGGHG